MYICPRSLSYRSIQLIRYREFGVTSGLTFFSAGAGTLELKYSVSLMKLTPA
jgi:hypothetical protein